MWELVEVDVGERREKELENTEEFWGFMKRHGSQTRRHLNSEESARDILSMFVPETSNFQAETVTLAIQKELADDHKTLDKTGAGQLLDGTWAEEKQSLLREVEEVRDAVRIANEERDHTMAHLLQEQQQEMNMKVEKMREEQEKLRVTMEQLHEERLAKYQKMLDEQQELSRTLSEDLKHKAKLQDNQRDEHVALATSRMDKFQEQQAAVTDLQGQLDGMSLSSNNIETNPNTCADLPKYTFDIKDLTKVVTCLLFNSDGSTLFVGTEKQRIRVYDRRRSYEEWCWVHVDTLVWSIPFPKMPFSRPSLDHVRCLARSNDDLYLVAACRNKLFRFKRKPHGRYEIDDFHQGFRHWSDGLHSLAVFSDDKKEYLVCGGLGNRYVFIYDPNFGPPGNEMRLTGIFDMSELIKDGLTRYECFEISRDGEFAMGLENGKVITGKFKGGDIMSPGLEWCMETPDSVGSLAWCHDGRLLIGTRKGFFISSPDGTTTPINGRGIYADADCWIVPIYDTGGWIGTLSCREPSRYIIREGQITLLPKLEPFAFNVDEDILSSQKVSYFQTAQMNYAGIGLASLPFG
ncbi:hypothetical protein FLAG1_12019 [Fusarium langsethiae]|uniref:Uncharacterized protein n=1 Tax=Fusarium langsethiae TaxID=179993 RepID=A0A0M9ELU3_FUSLA|nr:hypothetical protein FLAG1_12019 [Fusarium langsethiae]GKU09690.1 unnamed protein product [Fusarium langsethiae]GKU14484.1 unnamed protein product [Fusarium langsethiae]